MGTIDNPAIDTAAADVAALRTNQDVRTVLDELCRLTRMGFAAVARVTEDRWIACQVLDRVEFGLAAGDELAIKTTICNDIRESGKAVIIDHVGGDPAWRTHPIPIIYGFESYVSLPIVLADGSFFGTLCAIDTEPRSLRSPELVSMMESFARRIATIVSSTLR